MTANKQLAALKALDSLGPYTLPENALFSDVHAWLSGPISYTEFRKVLTDLEHKRLAVCIDGEDGQRWKITDNGKARLAELFT